MMNKYIYFYSIVNNYLITHIKIMMMIDDDDDDDDIDDDNDDDDDINDDDNDVDVDDNDNDDDDDGPDGSEKFATRTSTPSHTKTLSVPSFLGLSKAELSKRNGLISGAQCGSDGGNKTPRSARSVDLDDMVDEQLSEVDDEEEDEEDCDDDDRDEGRSRSGSAATAVSDTDHRRRPSLISFISNRSFRLHESFNSKSKTGAKVSFHHDETSERESFYASNSQSANANANASENDVHSSSGRSRVMHVAKLTSSLFSSKRKEGFHSSERSDSQRGYVSASALAEQAAAESSKSLQSECSRVSHGVSDDRPSFNETRSFRSESVSSAAGKVLYRPEMIEGWLVKRSRSVTGFGYKWKRRYCRINIKMCSLMTASSET